jgi:Ring finger domain/PA domain
VYLERNGEEAPRRRQEDDPLSRPFRFLSCRAWQKRFAMSVEELRSYCPVCDEACPRDHERICTVCGAELQLHQQHPAAPLGRNDEDNDDDDDDEGGGEASGSEGGRRLPLLRQQRSPSQGDSEEAGAGAGGNVELLALLEQTISDLRRQQQQQQHVFGVGDNDGGRAGAQADPAVLRRADDLRQVTESLTRAQAGVRQLLLRLADLTGGPSLLSLSSARPTAPAYLEGIPRVTLTPQSTVFAEATVAVNGTAFRAVPGDFGVNHLAHRVPGAAIVYCGTGRGGIDAQAMAQIQQVLSKRSRGSLPTSSDEAMPISSPNPPLVLLFDRGGDVTFVGKAMLAQHVGACAAIIANHVSDPWPYRMADSSNEAQRRGLQIPVVMVRKEDARSILGSLRQGSHQSGPVTCDVEILPAGKSSECAVCLQSMQAGETIMVLPSCRHAFHDSCAATWLQSHNTCPYCRSELPTTTNDNHHHHHHRNNEQQQLRDDAANRGDPLSGGSGDFYG